jgi:hypothetical protein
MKNQVFIFLGIVSFYLASCSGNNSSSATSRKDSTETVDTIHQDTTARDSTASKKPGRQYNQCAQDARELKSARALREAILITDDIYSFTNAFAEMIALHRFWDREIQRKVPA